MHECILYLSRGVAFGWNTGQVVVLLVVGNQQDRSNALLMLLLPSWSQLAAALAFPEAAVNNTGTSLVQGISDSRHHSSSRRYTAAAAAVEHLDGALANFYHCSVVCSVSCFARVRLAVIWACTQQ